MTGQQMRKLALALPGVEERSHFGHPDFRVKGKIFGGLTQDETTANLKLTPDLQDAIVSAEPETFAPAAGAWGRGGWTTIRLAGTTSQKVRPLLVEAHTLVSTRKTRAKRTR